MSLSETLKEIAVEQNQKEKHGQLFFCSLENLESFSHK